LLPVTFFQRYELKLQRAKSCRSGVLTPRLRVFECDLSDKHVRRQGLSSCQARQHNRSLQFQLPGRSRIWRPGRGGRADPGRQSLTHLPSYRLMAARQDSTRGGHFRGRSKYLASGKESSYAFSREYFDQLYFGPVSQQVHHLLTLSARACNSQYRIGTKEGASMKNSPGMEARSACTVNGLSVSPSNADHVTLCGILQESKPDIDTDCRWARRSQRKALILE
jgi:hypothetical protein